MQKVALFVNLEPIIIECRLESKALYKIYPYPCPIWIFYDHPVNECDSLQKILTLLPFMSEFASLSPSSHPTPVAALVHA